MNTMKTAIIRDRAYKSRPYYYSARQHLLKSQLQLLQLGLHVSFATLHN